MKKILFSLLASLLSLSPVQAQRLVAFDRFGTNWASTDVSTKNKPNGYMYRLRKDIQCDDLPRVPETERLELFIAEPIDIGWLGFYRLPTSADNYGQAAYGHHQPLRRQQQPLLRGAGCALGC